MAFVAPLSTKGGFLASVSNASTCPASSSSSAVRGDKLTAAPMRAANAPDAAVTMAFSSIDNPASAVIAFDKSVETSTVVINAVYKQVFGNAYLMESEKADLSVAESQFREGTITVRELVSAFAKSEAYKKRYFERAGPHKFIEFNMKHLLGRAPSSQGEISFHVKLLAEQGYEAEIDSYVDSAEYSASFGEDIVPRFVFKGCYPKNDDFNRMCILRAHWDGCSTSTVTGSTLPSTMVKAKLIMGEGDSCGNPVAIQRGIRAEHYYELSSTPKMYPNAPLNSNAGLRVRVKVADNLYTVFETDPMLAKGDPEWKKELMGTKKWNGVWY